MAIALEARQPKLDRDQYGRLLGRIHCSSCNRGATIVVRSPERAGVPEFIDKKIRELGWVPGKNRDRDLCPSCGSTAKPHPKPTTKPITITPSQLDAAFETALAKAKETTTVLDVTSTVEPQKTRKAQVRLSRLEEQPIIKLLEQHITKLDDGFVAYANDMSDLKIVDAVNNPRVTELHVKSIRQELFGKMRRGGNHDAGRLQLLEKRVADLEAMVLELMEKR